MDIIVNIKQKFGNLSLRSKLVLGFTLLVIIISMFILVYFPSKLESMHIDAIMNKAKSIAEMTAYSISPAIFFNDKESMEEALKIAQQNKDVKYIVVKSFDEEILASFNLKTALQENYSSKQSQKVLFDERVTLVLVSDIKFQEITIGKLYLGISLKELKKEVASSRKSILLHNIIIFILGFAFVVGISLLIVKPLEKIVLDFKRIAAGDLSVRIESNSKDEVGMLSKSLNVMLDNIEAAYESLQNEVDFRKKTEEELRKAKEEVANALEHEKELNELKTRFITTVSHEYRTPLTIILSSTYLLEHYFLKNDLSRFNTHLSRIQTSVQDMTTLLEDVLSIGKGDTTELSVQVTTLNLVEVINDIIHQTKFVNKKNYSIEFHYDEDQFVIDSDYKLIYQIISNLISNSLKYSIENPSVVIEISSDGIDTFSISVTDNGIGIPEEDIGNLFNPFFRAKNVGIISGTGLGLSIVKRAVEVLKGKIFITSEVNKGSNFTIVLPKNISMNLPPKSIS